MKLERRRFVAALGSAGLVASAAAARTLGMEMRLIEEDATRDYDAAYRQSESLGVEAVVLPS